MAESLESLFTAALILLGPVILALPVSFAWRWWVGMESEQEDTGKSKKSIGCWNTNPEISLSTRC